MNYLQTLEKELTRPLGGINRKYTVLDLFAGCGGLALGFETEGFHTIGYEMLEDACQTYESNLIGPCHQLVLEAGQNLNIDAQVIIGGPPCQPLSVGGLQNGKNDKRDGFPAFLSAVNRLQPEFVLLENVRGLLYKNKAYFNEILQSLRTLGYIVEWVLLNSVDFGVPQRRTRLFIAAHRGVWKFTQPTRRGNHVTAGEALGDLAFAVNPDTKFLTKSMDEYVARYEKKSHCIRPRDLHLDESSRTVTCRNLNGATGDMLRVRLPDGRRKRLSVREGARLQSFPDWFEFHGSEGGQFNQIGNAVPPLLAKAFATSILDYLNNPFRHKSEEIKRLNQNGQYVMNFEQAPLA